MIEITVNNKPFRKYQDSSYYISSDGEIYSEISDRIIKTQYRPDGIPIVDIWNKEDRKQHHVPVFKLVYECWTEDTIPIEADYSRIDYRDGDNKNVDYRNLTMIPYNPDNNLACAKYFIIRDKEIDKTITFCGVQAFANYCGHSNTTNSIGKFTPKKWFKDRYELLESGSVETIEQYNQIKAQQEKDLSNI